MPRINIECSGPVGFFPLFSCYTHLMIWCIKIQTNQSAAGDNVLSVQTMSGAETENAQVLQIWLYECKQNGVGAVQ